MREVKIIPVERLMEIAASTPALFDDSLEVTETEAARARLAHESHLEWYRTIHVMKKKSPKYLIRQLGSLRRLYTNKHFYTFSLFRN